MLYSKVCMIALVMLYITKSEARSMQCGGKCEPSNDICPGGYVEDICECLVCGKALGEQCGGIGDMYGFCGKGLRCSYPLNDAKVEAGICKEDNVPVAVEPPTLFQRFRNFFSRK